MFSCMMHASCMISSNVADTSDVWGIEIQSADVVDVVVLCDRDKQIPHHHHYHQQQHHPTTTNSVVQYCGWLTYSFDVNLVSIPSLLIYPNISQTTPHHTSWLYTLVVVTRGACVVYSIVLHCITLYLWNEWHNLMRIHFTMYCDNDCLVNLPLSYHITTHHKISIVSNCWYLNYLLSVFKTDIVRQ